MSYADKRTNSLFFPEPTLPYGWTMSTTVRGPSLPAHQGGKRMGETDLLSLEHLLARAMAKRNAVALELMLAPEFSVRSDGQDISRSEWLDLLPKLRTRSLDVKDVSADHFGEVAVLQATLHWQAHVGDPRRPTLILDGVYKVTDVWARRNGRWQLCSRASQKVLASGKDPSMSAA